MTTPTSRGAYKVYYDVLDRALESEAGLRIEVADKGAAFQYRVRLHTARTLDRKLSRQVREPDDPLYGLSDYDTLTVRVKDEDGKWWVYIEAIAAPGHVEELAAE